MTELTASQIAEALRKCVGTIACDGCPYQSFGVAKCIQQMQKDAAAMIDGQKCIIDQQAGTLDKLRSFIRDSIHKK